jgi:hypothetical protein
MRRDVVEEMPGATGSDVTAGIFFVLFPLYSFSLSSSPPVPDERERERERGKKKEGKGHHFLLRLRGTNFDRALRGPRAVTIFS